MTDKIEYVKSKLYDTLGVSDNILAECIVQGATDARSEKAVVSLLQSRGFAPGADTAALANDLHSRFSTAPPIAPSSYK